MTPIREKPRTNESAPLHNVAHKSGEPSTKKAKAVPTVTVPDFDKVATHSIKALKQGGAEDHSVGPAEQKQIDKAIRAAKNDADVLAMFQDKALTKTPALKYNLVATYGEDAFAALVGKQAEPKRSALVAEYSGHLSRSAEKALIRHLAQSKSAKAVATAISSIALRDPAHARDMITFAVNNKLSHKDLIAGAQKGQDGIAMELFTEHYRRTQLDSGEQPLASTVRKELLFPTEAQATLTAFQGVSPPETQIRLPADLDYIAATGDIQPHVQAFIDDALKTKDPKKLAAAAEIMELRQAAVANEFVSAGPATMTKDQLLMWLNEAGIAEGHQDLVDKARGKDTKSASGLQKAILLHLEIRDGTNYPKGPYEAASKLGEADKRLFAHVLVSTIKPNGLDHLFMSSSDDKITNALSSYVAVKDLIVSAAGSERTKIFQLVDTRGGSYHQEVLFEARNNAAFRRDLISTINDPLADKQTAAYAAKIMREIGTNMTGLIEANVEAHRAVTQALMATPIDVAALHKALKKGGAELATYTYKEIVNAKQYGLIDKLEPSDMRARVQAEAQMAKLASRKPPNFSGELFAQDLAGDRKSLAAYAEQVGAYAAREPEFGKQLAIFAVANPDSDVGKAVIKGFGVAGISNELIAPRFGPNIDAATSPDRLVELAQTAKQMLGPKGEQIVAAAFAKAAQKNPTLVKMALERMDAEMAWRVRGEWVRAAAGDLGEKTDAALKVYADLVGSATIPSSYRDEFRAGVAEWMKDPKVREALEKNPNAAGLRKIVEPPPRRRLEDWSANVADLS